MRWNVTIYDQRAIEQYRARGRTRTQAFNRALAKSGTRLVPYVTLTEELFATINHPRGPQTEVSITAPQGICVCIQRA